MPSPSLESALVRILRAEGDLRRPVGAGFLVSPQHIITCAHVVNCAFGLPKNAADQSEDELFLDFPLLTDRPLLRAKILRWFPVQDDSSVGKIQDIAVLELLPETSLPDEARPAPVVLPHEQSFFDKRVRMCGFPVGVDNGTYANGVLQGLNAKGWVEIHHQGSEQIEAGFSGTAVWSAEENAAAGMTVSVLNRQNARVAYMIPAALLIKAFPDLNEHSRPANPYRGLEAFREQDVRFFFGRETTISRIKQTVETQPVVVAIGASGSGKSSVIFAGLLPSLKEKGCWLTAHCRPKKQPFYELAACLVPFLYEDELERIKKTKQCAADLSAGELDLFDLIRRIVLKNNGERFLLIIDQFEELYTLNDGSTSRSFIDCLFKSKFAEELVVLTTMRADFLETAVGYTIFAETLSKYPPLIIPPISEHGLRGAVERPATLLNIRFEEGLVDLIIRDVGNEPGRLPLLEFCLTQLWERLEHRQLTHNAYKSIGGVQQALANHADAVYTEFYGEDWERIRQIFLKLVRPGQGTEDIRQVAPLELFSPEQRSVIKKLADRRLIVTGQDAKNRESTVEVVHEALIGGWQILQQWVNEEREFLLWREKLRVLLRQWQDSDHHESTLIRGIPLNEALKWLVSHEEYLGDNEREFIEVSEHVETEELKRASKLAQLEIVNHELEKNKDLLVEAERYSTGAQVAAQLAHQIRNPISSIGGTARLLSRKTTDPQLLRFFDMMTMEVTRIEQTLEDLFNFVDTTPVKKERVLVYFLIVKTLMLFYKAMEKQGIEYKAIVPEQLKCEIDPNQMKRVLVHLLRNAVEAMENGGNLEIEVTDDAEYIRIAVRDSGMGITATALQKVADPFFTTKVAGTGLGLALVERIVKDHQGKLHIRCRDSGGTEVEITLPQ